MSTTTETTKKAPEKKVRPPFWKLYRVRFDFVTRLCGSVPADPEIVRKWLDSRAPKTQAPGTRPIEEIQEEVLATLAQPEEEPEYSRLVFQKQPNGLVLRAATVRAHMKDCARVISTRYVGRAEGEAAFSTKVINAVYPDPMAYWLPILHQDGSAVLKADGHYDKAVHVRDAHGKPQNGLKTIDYIENASVSFGLRVLGDSVKQSDLEHLFRYGGVHGYGGERGDGEGKYLFQLESAGEEQ